MAFGQSLGPPATGRQVRELLELLEAAGHSDFRDARGPMGFTQRQAAGKFTRDEADEFIARLEAEVSGRRTTRGAGDRRPRDPPETDTGRSAPTERHHGPRRGVDRRARRRVAGARVDRRRARLRTDLSRRVPRAPGRPGTDPSTSAPLIPPPPSHRSNSISRFDSYCPTRQKLSATARLCSWDWRFTDVFGSSHPDQKLVSTTKSACSMSSARPESSASARPGSISMK